MTYRPVNTSPEVLAEPGEHWRHLLPLIAGAKRRIARVVANTDLTIHPTYSAAHAARRR